MRPYFLAASMVVWCVLPAQADRSVSKTSPKILAAFRDVVAKASEATVQIRCNDKNVALGTIVDGDGFILTKHSELSGTPTVRLKNGRDYEAKVVGSDERYDVALLKIDRKGLKPVDWVDSSAAPVGNWVAAPGLDRDPVGVGVVSVASRKMPTKDVVRRPGGGVLGVMFESAARGLKVIEVLPDSGAQKAGVKVDDLIVGVGGESTVDREALVSVLQRFKPGEKVTVKVKREKETMELKVVLGKKTLSRGDFQNGLGSDLSDLRAGFPVILQHDTVLKPQECGGPLVDLDGKVIGINIARAGRTETYAIPSESIKPLLKELKAGAK